MQLHLCNGYQALSRVRTRRVTCPLCLFKDKIVLILYFLSCYVDIVIISSKSRPKRFVRCFSFIVYGRCHGNVWGLCAETAALYSFKEIVPNAAVSEDVTGNFLMKIILTSK
ncbi:hypothetical protein BDR06DRAFT_338293 [Suillus hirtellus]|nr:hypothetical protein BDR06DRAFT_338293 [Suillus hirtellus]